jgi:hypothetical protein
MMAAVNGGTGTGGSVGCWVGASVGVAVGVFIGAVVESGAVVVVVVVGGNEAFWIGPATVAAAVLLPLAGVMQASRRSITAACERAPRPLNLTAQGLVMGTRPLSVSKLYSVSASCTRKQHECSHPTPPVAARERMASEHMRIVRSRLTLG